MPSLTWFPHLHLLLRLLLRLLLMAVLRTNARVRCMWCGKEWPVARTAEQGLVAQQQGVSQVAHSDRHRWRERQAGKQMPWLTRSTRSHKLLGVMGCKPWADMVWIHCR